MSVPQDLNDLFYFAQVVECGGFAAAGRRLNLPKSKLSRRVALLEERLGVRLLQRSTRKFSITDIGRDFYRHCVAMQMEAQAAQDVVDNARSEPQGVLRVSAPISLLHMRVSLMIRDFLLRYPKVRIDVEAVNRRVDVIAEGIDVALRVRIPPFEEEDLIVRNLGEGGGVLVASPALLNRQGRPARPADLQALDALAMTKATGNFAWDLVAQDGERLSLPYQPRLVTDDMVTLRDCALAGIGAASLPMFMVAEDIAAGRLETILPGWSPPKAMLQAAFPSRRGQAPAVRLFIDYLAEEFGRPESTGKY
ncbi:LysR substrate-binding domain-containing protein [Lacibacterium aquatile]|uniref:LysR substrate-binding domain-containing protein n=1 Tax=Lacibacterium aquatile TaxID=1168082 RepID=A0ABW5DMT1_9PROT